MVLLLRFKGKLGRKRTRGGAGGTNVAECCLQVPQFRVVVTPPGANWALSAAARGGFDGSISL